MTNDEFQMTKEARNPKHEAYTSREPGALRSFELCHSFDIRHSTFDIRDPVGGVIGITIALATGRVLRAYRFGVSSADPVTFIAGRRDHSRLSLTFYRRVP